MSAEKLKALRELSHQTQASFAKAMGVPLRTYENLESGRVEVRRVHLNAAKWAVVEFKAGDDMGFIETPEDIWLTIEQAASNL